MHCGPLVLKAKPTTIANGYQMETPLGKTIALACPLPLLELIHSRSPDYVQKSSGKSYCSQTPNTPCCPPKTPTYTIVLYKKPCLPTCEGMPNLPKNFEGNAFRKHHETWVAFTHLLGLVFLSFCYPASKQCPFSSPDPKPCCPPLQTLGWTSFLDSSCRCIDLACMICLWAGF